MPHGDITIDPSHGDVFPCPTPNFDTGIPGRWTTVEDPHRMAGNTEVSHPSKPWPDSFPFTHTQHCKTVGWYADMSQLMYNNWNRRNLLVALNLMSKASGSTHTTEECHGSMASTITKQ
jgi:hypothetical protein